MNTPLLYTRCLRCGRALKDHKSKSRGYGPECWQKVKHAIPPQGAPLTETRSIENIFTVNAVYDSIRVRVSSHSCPSCGALLSSAEVHSYDHEDGLNLRGFLRPQWVYVTCSGCRVDIALHKLTRNGCGDLCKHYRQVSIAEALRA
ncbi:MAG TPA: hypothetical protein HA306_01040 [Methanosarcina sp.]|nr:hypothetical protein [Methanosarcina sp.]